MLARYRAPEGASLFDLVLNTYTSLNLLTKFILDNNIRGYDLITKVGDEFLFDTDLIVDNFMFDDIIDNQLIFVTGKGLPQEPDNYLQTELPENLQDESFDDFLY